MKLTISKEQLIVGLQAVQNVVGTRTTLPILSNVLLRAEGEGLNLTATDLDVTISCQVQATVGEPGATTLPVKKLFSIVRELASASVELDVNEKNVCSLQAGPSYFRINGLPAEEFPPLPTFDRQRRVALKQGKTKGMLRRTSFAVSTDESRYVLNGLYFSLKDHKLTLVATDGRRLALTDEEVELDPASEGEFIVPTKAINELNHLIHDDGELEITFAENQVAFVMTGENQPATRLISKLVDGSYPNYRQVIPAESKERITLVREELLQALRRAEIMTSDKSNSVKLNFGRNSLAITANTPEVGESRESMAINYKGEDFSVAFNPTFLMDPLKALEEDEIFFELSDELSPGVIKVNSQFLYVIMPMRMS